jgi:hypothetical protein
VSTVQPGGGADVVVASDECAADVAKSFAAFLFFGVRTRYLNGA